MVVAIVTIRLSSLFSGDETAMKRSAAILIIVISAAVAFGAQASGDWIKYTSPEGRYSVLLPAQPKLSTQEAANADGQKFQQYLAQVNDPTGYYLTGYFDLLSGDTYSLDKGRDGIIRGVNGALVSEGEISLGGNPGRELKISLVGPDKVDYLVYARMFNIDKRVYILQFIIAKSEDNKASAANTARFFDSFKTIKTP